MKNSFKLALAGLVSGSAFTLINVIIPESRAPYDNGSFLNWSGSGGIFTDFGSPWVILPGFLMGIALIIMGRGIFKKSDMAAVVFTTTLGYAIAYFSFIYLFIYSSLFLGEYDLFSKETTRLLILGLCLFLSGFLSSLVMSPKLLNGKLKYVFFVGLLGGAISILLIFFVPFKSVVHNFEKVANADNASLIYPVWQTLFGFMIGYFLDKK